MIQLLRLISVTGLFLAFSANAETMYTSANLDFTSINRISHNSKFISSVGNFSLVGKAYGSDAGIQGIYSAQDPAVLERCLALAEQMNLSRKAVTTSLLRIQVMPDPINKGFALIQYCTLYQ